MNYMRKLTGENCQSNTRLKGKVVMTFKNMKCTMVCYELFYSSILVQAHGHGVITAPQTDFFHTTNLFDEFC